MGCGLLHRALTPVLGRISGLLAECSTVLVESSVRLAFWADFVARPGRFGAFFGAVRPSKIVLPPRREHDFSFFVLSRSFDPPNRLLDPICGPLGAVLGPILGLLGLSWALLGAAPGAPKAPKRRCERALWSCLGQWSWSLGPVGGFF